MPDLSRSQFCDLVRISPETLKSLSRREQLPFSIDQKASGRGYTLFEAFLTIAAQSFAEKHGVNITRSADIAGALPEALAPKWQRIAETGRALADGTGQRIEEIMCGRYCVAGLNPPRSTAGTVIEIANELTILDHASDGQIFISASRSLALLITRADRLNIEIPDDFWTVPFSYRPRQSGWDLGKANMQALIDEGVHLEDTEN